VNLSAALAMQNKRVLLIDSDPQANATTSLGFHRDTYEFNLYNVMLGTKSIKDVILNSEIENLKLLPANIGLVGIEKEFYSERKDRELLLKKAIDEVRSEYDYIIIDAPPALGPLTINALSASTSVIIPIQCEFFALEGLAQLLNTIKLVRQTINRGLQIKGFLPTMYSGQNNLAKQVFADLAQHFEDKLFRVNEDKESFIVIPRNIKLAEAPSFGKPSMLYDINSSGSKAYISLAKSILFKTAKD
jgi:chromosome partitioning protein